jgi:hypothetical protein
MIFQIRDSWYTFDDYIAIKLKKNTETNTKGTKKAEGITKRKLSLEEITNYNSRIYQLYMNVTKMLHSTPLSDR